LGLGFECDQYRDAIKMLSSVLSRSPNRPRHLPFHDSPNRRSYRHDWAYSQQYISKVTDGMLLVTAFKVWHIVRAHCSRYVQRGADMTRSGSQAMAACVFGNILAAGTAAGKMPSVSGRCLLGQLLCKSMFAAGRYAVLAPSRWHAVSEKHTARGFLHA